MLKIKDSVDLKELEKFSYKRLGGTEKEHYHWGYYSKTICPLFDENSYEIIIPFDSKRILCSKIFAYSTSFEAGIKVKKRWINDLIKANLVEEVSNEKI